MLARSIGQEIMAGKDPFAAVRPTLDAASLRIANIETTIADPSKAVRAAGKLYTFNAPLGTIQTIKNAHIDVSVLANNHTSDFGPSGTADMVQQFQTAGLATVGAGDTPEQAFAPLIKQVTLQCATTTSSLKVGFIAANDIENIYTAVSDSRAGSAYFDQARLRTSIEQARAAGAAFIIVIPHWGVEYQTTPTARQQQWAHWFIDSGADAVIGGHPHVIQPSETYQEKPIVYSMGNFVFDQMDDAADGQMVSLPLTQTVRVDNTTTPQPPALGAPLLTPYHLDSDGFPRPTN